MKYRTIQNDRWDQISMKHYGHPDHYKEIIKANPYLSDEIKRAPLIPAGVELEIPELPPFNSPLNKGGYGGGGGASAVEKIREPLYKITWLGKEITKDLEDYFLGLTYTDHLHGKSDEIDISFEDRDDLWKDSWYPSKGDKLEIEIGLKENDSEKWLKAGTFKIDEITFSGPPDTISIKGLSAFITESQRQKKTKAWENVKLSQVISELASRNGLESEIEIDTDIQFNRLDQKNKSDLAFIKELANKYGYNTKIDSERLIFQKPDKLEEIGAVIVIKKGDADLKNCNITDKSHETYKACEVRYHDPKTKQAITHKEDASDPDDIVSEDVLKISERVENKQQAMERAKAELKRKNKFKHSGSLTYMGNPYLTAGANIELKGFYNLDGKYLIEEARHTINKGSGYETSIEVRKT
ncbi:MAG: tail protein X [Nitrospirae bacterium]|nr:tail protein X [Nitrospirota bacterium]